MILRHWKGIARTERADDYLAYLQNERFPRLSSIDGFISASVAQRAVDQGVEFLVISLWDSMEAVRQFTGPDAELAVVPPEVAAMMADYDRHVSHYELTEEFRSPKTQA